MSSEPLMEASILSPSDVDFLKKRAKRIPSNFEIGFSEGYERGFRAGQSEAMSGMIWDMDRERYVKQDDRK